MGAAVVIQTAGLHAASAIRQNSHLTVLIKLIT